MKAAVTNQKHKNLSREEKKVVSLLAVEERTFDELAKELKMTPVSLSIVITGLELKKLIGNKYGTLFLTHGFNDSRDGTI